MGTAGHTHHKGGRRRGAGAGEIRGGCRALACADQPAGEKHRLPRAQLFESHRRGRAGARPRNEDSGASGVLHQDDPIPWDQGVTAQVDYEVELGVVIGVGGKNIARANALDHVFGYTVINDVSARDVQQRHLQWFKGKSLDGFCPMGPVVVTADEFGDPQSKKIGTRVNGVQKQNSTTANMIFPVDVIIEALSAGMTLEPGDVIATGTPEGVGLGRTPQEFLNDGDMVETEVEGIGILRNQIVKTP